MIPAAIAKKQVMRLGQLMGFPRDNAPALEDMVAAFEKMAESKEESEACVAAFMENADASTRCPLASQVRRWFNEFGSQKQKEESRRRTSTCGRCGGTGFRIIERGGLTGAAECECRRGE
jgi:hypothetical protein